MQHIELIFLTIFFMFVLPSFHQFLNGFANPVFNDEIVIFGLRKVNISDNAIKLSVVISFGYCPFLHENRATAALSIIFQRTLGLGPSSLGSYVSLAFLCISSISDI